MQKNYSAKFILVGNEPISEEFNELNNIVATQKYGLSIEEDLAIIQSCEFFMGMATGPCNISLLSNQPCIIFKNPEHHKEEMKQELDARERFNFCSEHQKLARVMETPEILLKEFKALYPPFSCNSKDLKQLLLEAVKVLEKELFKVS